MPTAEITSVSTTPTNLSSITGPLGVLYTNANQLQSLQVYPADLGSSQKNHYIKFWIKQIVPSSVTTDINGNVVTKEGNQQTIADIAVTPQTTQSKDVICLYMPDTLSASYNASYDELSLTNDLGRLVKGIQQVESALHVSDSGIRSTASATASDAALRNLLSGTAGAVVNAAGGNGQDASDLALQGGGYAINPQMQVIYRGVGFREFQLSFTLTPQTRSDAQAINQIIGTFKYHFAPDLLVGDATQNGMYFVPPSYFNIEFMFGAAENAYLPRYGDCILTSIDVNYAPNGFAVHTDGAPVQTQLNLHFKEIEIVTKAKLVAGYNYTGNSNNYANGGEGGLR